MFQAKKGTAMENAPEPSMAELLWTIAVARLMFGPAMNIQAPPNLIPGVPVLQCQCTPHTERLPNGALPAVA